MYFFFGFICIWVQAFSHKIDHRNSVFRKKNPKSYSQTNMHNKKTRNLSNLIHLRARLIITHKLQPISPLVEKRFYMIDISHQSSFMIMLFYGCIRIPIRFFPHLPQLRVVVLRINNFKRRKLVYCFVCSEFIVRLGNFSLIWRRNGWLSNVKIINYIEIG